MAPQAMAAVGGLFALVYIACLIGIVIYVFILLGRFVRAHERAAGALETIARKLREAGNP